MPHPALLSLWLLFTGLCGLSAEVILGRRLQLHLGSSGASQAVALATFLGGLALGAALAGRVQRGRLATMRRPLLAWAGLEAFIGCWLIALPWLADAVFAAFELLAQSVPAGSVGLQVAKLGVAALLAMPLTTAMGATLPVLAVAIQRATLLPSEDTPAAADPQQTNDVGVRHEAHARAAVALLSRLYAVNALGAAVGAGLAGYVLLPALGLDAPLLAAGTIDLWIAILAGAAALRLPVVPALPLPAAAETPASLAAGRVSPLLLAIAGLTGLSALVGEVLWTRLSALSLGASAYAFSLMLVVAVSGVALGSGLAMRLQATLGRPLELLLVTQLLAAVGSLWLAFRQDGLAVDLYALRSLLEPSRDAWPLWLTMSTVFVGLHLLPLAMALGAAFPLLLAAARQEGADPDRAAARLLAVNTAGNLVGALGGGFVVLPWLGLTGALVLAAAISLCGALLAAPTARLRGVVAGVGLGLGLLTAIAQPSGDLLARGLFRTRPSSLADYAKQVDALRELTTLFRHDGKDGTVSVDRYKDGELVFRVSGKPDGGTRDTVTQAMLGHLGMLLRPGAKEALLIGLGTGQTAAALASHAGVAVHVVELSRAMPDIARLFGQLNDNVLNHPRVRVTLADAREVLRQIPPHSLDLVVSEPSNPWVVGVADLYTLQSFARIRERLRPGGLLVQWMQRYEIGDENLTRILCTMHGALPNMVVFRMEPFDLALIGSAEPIVWDQAAVERLLAQETVQANLARGGNKAMPRTALHFAAAQIAGPQTVAQLCDGFDNWLVERQPQLEYDAPADFYARRQSERLLRRLDTRRSSTPDTWLADRLSKQPLTDADKADLFQFYVESRSPEEFPLAAALAGPDDMPVTVRAVTDHLPDPEAPSEAGKHAAWCAWIRQQLPWLLSEFTTQYGPVSRAPNTAAWAKRCTQAAKPR